MKLTICDLLYKEIVWNKEKVTIKTEDNNGNIKSTDIKRLEFQYDAIDNNYEVIGIEVDYDEYRGAYLVLYCGID